MQAPYCYSNDEIIILGHTLVSLYCPKRRFGAVNAIAKPSSAYTMPTVHRLR